jgi:hypothetical protein
MWCDRAPWEISDSGRRCERRLEVVDGSGGQERKRWGEEVGGGKEEGGEGPSVCTRCVVVILKRSVLPLAPSLLARLARLASKQSSASADHGPHPVWAPFEPRSVLTCTYTIDEVPLQQQSMHSTGQRVPIPAQWIPNDSSIRCTNPAAACPSPHVPGPSLISIPEINNPPDTFGLPWDLPWDHLSYPFWTEQAFRNYPQTVANPYAVK